MSWADIAEQPTPVNEHRTTSDFLIRRARVIVQGRVTDTLSASVQVGQDNVGAKLLTPDGGISIKDAYVNYRAADALQIAVGQFKVPFLRANLESGFNQILVDRGTLPTLRPAREGSRDLGVMGWGNAGGLQYRFALLDGSDQDAADSGVRLTARIAHNWFTREAGFGYTGSHLGRSRVLHVAAQADVQDSRTDSRDEGGFRLLHRDYRAYAVEAFFEQPLGGWALTGDTAWFDRSDDYRDAATATRRLRGSYVQTGLLLPPRTGPGRIHLAFRREQWDTDRGVAHTTTARTTFGANYYLDGHSRKVQADYTFKDEDAGVENDELRLSLVLVL